MLTYCTGLQIGFWREALHIFAPFPFFVCWPHLSPVVSILFSFPPCGRKIEVDQLANIATFRHLGTIEFDKRLESSVTFCHSNGMSAHIMARELYAVVTAFVVDAVPCRMFLGDDVGWCVGFFVCNVPK